MSITLSDQDKRTLRTAAYGAVSLLAAAGAAGSPHKIATDGSIALASATGLVGHVLAEKTTGVNLNGKSVAAIADHVLPAISPHIGVYEPDRLNPLAEYLDGSGRDLHRAYADRLTAGWESRTNVVSFDDDDVWGRNYGRAVNFTLPNLGSQSVRMEPVTANRAPNVHIIDIRFDKSFGIGGVGRLTAMIDVFNALNSDVPIVFRTLTGNVAAGQPYGNYKEVIALLKQAVRSK